MRERVTAATSGLMALLGIESDSLPQKPRAYSAGDDHDRCWRAGKDVDLGTLIRLIQKPNFDKVGFMDLESFFPSKNRFALAMTLNNLVASPSFQPWLEGESLDVQRLLYTTEGKPRLTIISIAHLSDSERMFFVTILLNEMIAWMRNQSGTTSLRALLYMDEVFGYFPPSANPPSKMPMLTLMKQARAFGLGVVLATQNPVDLDYKGLSNAGTWFLGRLQTERDKARVLEGLEGASAAAGAKFDRGRMEKILAGLGNRVFLMNNVHEDEPIVFQSRWALSFLRGPISREQIAMLMDEKRAAMQLTPPPDRQWHRCRTRWIVAIPFCLPGIEETFLVTSEVHCWEMTSCCIGQDYWPARGCALSRPAQESNMCRTSLCFCRRQSRSSRRCGMTRKSPRIHSSKQQPHADSDGKFATMPVELNRVKTFTELQSALKEHLYRTQKLKLWKCAELKEVSQTGESEGDFRSRITHGSSRRT